MRIAHVITRMIVGGAQENTLLNCQDLIRVHGDDVLLITGPALGPEGDLLAQQALAQHSGEPVPVRLIPALRRAIHPWRDVVSYRQIGRALREFRPDVVHTHSAKAGVLGRMAAWSLGVPAVIHTVHGAPFHPYQHAAPRVAFAACERFAARRCHAMISVADAMTELLVSARVAPREKFTTIYSGMELDPFRNANQAREATRRQFGFSPDQIVIGKIARLFHLKGHEYVLRAAARLVASQPQIRFLFVGDGILRAEYESWIRQRGLDEYIRFAGLVPPSRIPDMIGAFDILVHTSLREGLARALPQALLAGKPIVSFDVDGAREVCVNDQTGYLVPAKDVDALTAALARLAADPEQRQAMGDRGRAACETKFDHRRMTQRIRELYLRILATGGKN
ncbi:MAG: glycosyltransferase family 4 protein [Planctomycetes bacterium]|nr:glycosyltransferase family 4 protein [Planctomycetota bacterium]